MEDCQHRRAVQRTVQIGRRQIKVYGCAVHGECTYRTHVDGMKSCKLCTSQLDRPVEPCDHRREEIGRPVCVPCGGVKIKTFRCEIHGPCSIATRIDEARVCATCCDKNATLPPHAMPHPSPPRVSRVAAVTCFFNPHRGRRRVEIYRQFAAGMREQGLDLFCIEADFGNQPRQVDSDWFVQVDPEAVLWHKEALLNVAIDRLPDRYDAVAWIDADVVYLGNGLADRIVESLRSYAVVQPWSEIRYLGPDGQPISPWRPSMASYNRQQAAPDTAPQRSYPGMAWAASREVLAQVGGMYDRCITGAGDCAWASGAWGDFLPLTQRGWSQSLVDHSTRWAERLASLTLGRVGMVAAQAEHLYHGSLENRQYIRRNAIMGEINYDPERHIEIAPNGTLRWSDEAPPALRAAVSEYMHNRREDE